MNLLFMRSYAQPIGKVNKEDFVKEKSFYEFVEKEGL